MLLASPSVYPYILIISIAASRVILPFRQSVSTDLRISASCNQAGPVGNGLAGISLEVIDRLLRASDEAINAGKVPWHGLTRASRRRVVAHLARLRSCSIAVRQVTQPSEARGGVRTLVLTGLSRGSYWRMLRIAICGRWPRSSSRTERRDKCVG